jgi:hypothetical protein
MCRINLIDLSQNIIFLGDFNFDLSSNKGNKLRDFIASKDLQFIDDQKVTRTTSGTLLDAVVSNCSQII